MVVPIGPDEVRQQLGVSVVRLCTRDTVPLPVAADRQGIDGVDLIPRTDERADQQASVGLDPHRHLARIRGMVDDQRVDAPHTLDPLWNPRLVSSLFPSLSSRQTS